MNPQSPPLKRLVDYWQSLTPASLAALGEVYAPDAYFRDPFNEVRGLAAIRPVFDDMFHRLDEPRFAITDTLEQGQGALLVWDFDFRIKSLSPQRARRIHGSSHIRFNDQDLVLYHRDYWDAAGELYEQLPGVGALMRFLKKRVG